MDLCQPTDVVSKAVKRSSLLTSVVACVASAAVVCHVTIGQGYTYFPKICEPPQNFWCQKSDMKQILYWGSAHVRVKAWWPSAQDLYIPPTGILNFIWWHWEPFFNVVYSYWNFAVVSWLDNCSTVAHVMGVYQTGSFLRCVWNWCCTRHWIYLDKLANANCLVLYKSFLLAPSWQVWRELIYSRDVKWEQFVCRWLQKDLMSHACLLFHDCLCRAWFFLNCLILLTSVIGFKMLAEFLQILFTINISVLC